MNVSEGESVRDILYLNFNQTSTALSVGTKNGYMLYDLDQVYECKPTYETKLPPTDGHVTDVCIIERNFCTSLIAYVTLNSPRSLVLYNYNKGTVIIEKLFPNTVLSVKLNRKNVVVCLEDSIYILNIMNLNEESMHAITSTVPNVKGLIALTYGNKNSLLAYPGSSANGDVQIFDATLKHAKTTIPAHTSALAALTFDEDGEKLATASIKGTLIRVFDVASGQVLFEFRRGMKRCVEIHSLTFNKDGDFLCASSNTETVHIFKLCAETVEQVEEENEGWMEMFGRVLTSSAKYLPTQMSDVLTQQRSFAYVHLPFVTQKTICAITKIQNTSYVMVASLEGFLYIYELNVEIGGACVLVKQHRLEGPLRPANITNALHCKSSEINLRQKEVSHPPNMSEFKTSPAHSLKLSSGTYPCRENSPKLFAASESQLPCDDLPVFSSIE